MPHIETLNLSEENKENIPPSLLQRDLRNLIDYFDQKIKTPSTTLEPTSPTGLKIPATIHSKSITVNIIFSFNSAKILISSPRKAVQMDHT